VFELRVLSIGDAQKLSITEIDEWLARYEALGIKRPKGLPQIGKRK
jgi:hypothetical protein